MSYAQTRALVIKMLPQGAVGAEIGVWKGNFSELILQTAQPRLLHLIDPWRLVDDPDHASAWYSKERGQDIEQIYGSVQARFADHVSSGQVQIHRKSSGEALESMPDEHLDFIYVDGDHAFEGVRADLDLAVSKTRSGGLICVDDHMLGKWWDDGVVRAVNEILGAHPRGLMLQFAANTQVVIRKR
ncbi:MAG: class I SAM-dependent methyltransferase [Pseudomonadota bacterium]